MSTKLQEAFRAEVKLGSPHIVGRVHGGTLRVIPIVGGTVSGDRLKGEVLPLGADWNTARDDSTMFIFARYLLKSSEGVLISVLNEGWGRLGNEAIEGVIRGEAVKQTGWYCKTHPRFEVSDPRYAWMNSTVFVAELLPPNGPDAVDIIFYELV